MKISDSGVHSNFGEFFHQTFKSYGAVYFALTLVVLMSYGYELFNFHLTIDEEMHGSQAGMWHAWIAQGRWGMALSNYILIPNPVVPVVSTFIGVLGLTLGVASILNSAFELDRVGLTAITAIAVTIPTLAFSLTFSTIAYGIGVGCMALAAANLLLKRHDWGSLAGACVLAGLAIGIYQTFVFVVAMIAVVFVWHVNAIKKENVVASVARSTIFVLGGMLFYAIINIVVLKSQSVDMRYVGQFIDINGFIHDPASRLVDSSKRVIEIIGLSPERFGIGSIWMRCLVLVAVALGVAYPLFNKDFRSLLGAIAIAFSLLAIAVFADAIAQGGAPLRSVIYIPVGVGAFIAYAYTVSGKLGKFVLLLLCGLSVVGNSQINNHLFASSAIAESRDRMLAQEIIAEARRLDPSHAVGVPYKIEIVGNHSWGRNGIQSKSETFGASFFEWDGGNRYRVAAYLSLNGLASTGASNEERERAYTKGVSMPRWPNQGWVAISNGILILKFDDYSIPQKAELCVRKISELCREENGIN